MRTSVPTRFIIGESLAWEKSFADYPASDGWTLAYYFRGAGKGFNATGTADGDDFLFSVAPAETSDCQPGKYYYQAFASLDDEKICVDSGDIEAIASLSSLTIGEEADQRSQVKKILDAVDAMIEGKASLDQMEYTIGSRQLKRYSLPDLIALRDKYQKLYNAEIRAEQAKKGISPVKFHKVRFKNPK